MSGDHVEAVLDAASSAAPVLAALTPDDRSRGLLMLASALEQSVDDLVEVAVAESGLGTDRLRGEVARTCAQLRLFADVVAGDDWLGLRLDEAEDGAPPLPRIVRFRVPMGPALVYEAGNFPFAFGVLGTDTAAALAAGCPVVVKTHAGHPATSARTLEIAADVTGRLGWPAGTLGALHSEDGAVAAMGDSRIRVATFTGSLAGGRALFDIASRRADPLPFYAEMGSVNPVFVFPEAARTRSREIAAGLAGSFGSSGGQLCTKPGLVFVPRDGAMEAAIVEAVREVPASALLTERISETHRSTRAALVSLESTEVLVTGRAGHDGEVEAIALAVDLAALEAPDSPYLEECFGPTVVVVRYDDVADLPAAASRIPGSLTASVHAADGEAGGDLVRLLVDRVGRLVWNGWPTGLRVGQAMHHGGPYPATSSPQFTSVGAAAIDRFLRPVAYQGVPDELLPDHVRIGLARLRQ